MMGVSVRSWREAMQTIAATAAALVVVGAILGFVFVPRSEIRALERKVNVAACAVILGAETCLQAHGMSRDELLRP